LHYRSALFFDPKNAGALNNLGVAYQNLTMPIHAVSAYQKAVEEGTTLASANLAYLLMNAGFANEAQQILDKAKSSTQVHANVGSALATLSQKKSSEDDQKKQMIDAATNQQEFLRACGGEFFGSTTKYDFHGKWTRDDGTSIDATQAGQDITMTWSLASKEYELTGIVSGNAALVSYRKMDYGYLDPSVKLGFKEVSKGYAVLTEQGSKLKVMLYENGSPSFWNLKKQSTEIIPNNKPQNDLE